MSTVFNTLPSTPEFPPMGWLGYGIDLSRLDPLDFASIQATRTQCRIVDITADIPVQTVKICGIEYEIPKVVTATEDNISLGSNYKFADGTLAVKNVQDDGALAYRLLSVTSGDNSHYPLDKALPTKNQYYFFVNDHGVYSGKLRGYYDYVDEKKLATYVSKLPPFNPQNPAVVKTYADFFGAVGSHFITGASYGARFQLEVWAANTHEDVNSNFARDVTASVKGLNDGGNYDQDVLGEPQYHTFDRLSQRIVRVCGGNPDLANALVNSPDPEIFKRWTASVLANPELVTVRASELWALLRDADDRILRGRANDIENAFDYISSLRKVVGEQRSTWITFESESGEAEFGILTPGAVIRGGDTDQVSLLQTLALGPPKIHWGSSRSSSQYLVVVAEIVNDGTPIDIYVSSRSGTARVNILGKGYTTKGGIQRYTNVPVS